LNDCPACLPISQTVQLSGVVQGRHRPRLAAKTFERLLILPQIIRQKLPGHEASQLRIFRFVDHAHSAAGQLFNDFIVRNGLPEQGAEILGV